MSDCESPAGPSRKLAGSHRSECRRRPNPMIPARPRRAPPGGPASHRLMPGDPEGPATGDD
eukprot:727405-Hanusia_phi.AAC.1